MSRSSPQFGLVIGTFAAVPYIHLQLEAARRLYPEVPVLIHDDSSAQADRLRALATEYGAEFVSTPARQTHHLGDLLVYPVGLAWAESRGIEIALKVSRRWIWRQDWRPSLAALAEESDADTFSNHTVSYDYGFRTECVGFRVRRWNASAFAADVAEQVRRRRSIFVENYIHRWAIRLSETGTPQWQAWAAEHPVPAERRGYASWDFMGTCRDSCHPNRLWHDSDPLRNYAALAAEWGLPYAVADFEDPNQGEGIGEPCDDTIISGSGLPALLLELGEGLIGAEVGVARGKTSRHILTLPQVSRLYGIDPFITYEDWCGTIAQDALDSDREEVVRSLAQESRFQLLALTSTAAIAELPSLDFVFLDGSHAYADVQRDLVNYWAKLRPGGLFSGHDYRALGEVRKAVDEFAAQVGATVRETEHDVWWWRKPV